MRKLLGYILVASPFAAVLLFVIIERGVMVFLFVIGVIVAITLVIGLGLYLIEVGGKS